jgi:hypothetical protein
MCDLIKGFGDNFMSELLKNNFGLFIELMGSFLELSAPSVSDASLTAADIFTASRTSVLVDAMTLGTDAPSTTYQRLNALTLRLAHPAPHLRFFMADFVPQIAALSGGLQGIADICNKQISQMKRDEKINWLTVDKLQDNMKSLTALTGEISRLIPRFEESLEGLQIAGTDAADVCLPPVRNLLATATKFADDVRDVTARIAPVFRPTASGHRIDHYVLLDQPLPSGSINVAYPNPPAAAPAG